jgi:hypothetical protein
MEGGRVGNKVANHWIPQEPLLRKEGSSSSCPSFSNGFAGVTLADRPLLTSARELIPTQRIQLYGGRLGSSVVTSRDSTRWPCL